MGTSKWRLWKVMARIGEVGEADKKPIIGNVCHTRYRFRMLAATISYRRYWRIK